MDPRPIGIFDSGVGGLSVTIEIDRQLPHERLIYYADSGRCPYGVRPLEEIRALSVACVGFLIAQGAKLIVVACNTASSAALPHLRAAYPDTPIVGMVPAVKPAALTTRSGKVVVLATLATSKGQALADVISQFAQGVEVNVIAPPGLVELVERGEVNSATTRALLASYIDPLLARGVDTLVLGCTHFPFLSAAIEYVSRGRMQLIDSGPAVARQTARVLAEYGLQAPPDQHGGLRQMIVYTSGDPAIVGSTLRTLLGFDDDVIYHVTPLRELVS
jgi:glutamate racemase